MPTGWPPDPRFPRIGPVPLEGRPSGTEPDSAEAAAVGQAAAQTYEPYYGLKERPFSLSADPKFLYKSRSHAAAFEDMLAAIRRREGLIVLTGDIGTGKTILCRAVLEHLDRKTFTTFVPDPSVSREDLLKMMLVDYGVMSVDDLKRGRLRGASRSDLSYPLYEFLNSLKSLEVALLIIDEAQNLSAPLFEEVRILSDLEGREKREKLLQLVLVGRLELQSLLKLPQMRHIDQRVSMRCEIEPLSPEAVAGYITHRLSVAGGASDRIEFPAAAVDAVYRGSGGVPRLINLICDRALQLGYVRRTATIGAELVWSAISDLGLIAAPAPETPEPLGTQSAPRGLFERATPRTEELPTRRDLEALLDLAPVTPRQTSLPVPQVALPEPPSSDPVVAWPAEEDGLSRPEGRLEGTPPRRRWWRHALFLTVLAGSTGAALWSLQYLLAERMPVTHVPPPPLLFKAPALDTPLLPDPSQATDLPGSPLAVRPSASSNIAGTATPEAYVIQVASFKSSRRADLLVQKLLEAGYRAYQVEVDLGPSGLRRRVFVGNYQTLAEAEAHLAQIRQIPGYADARVLDVAASRRSP